MRPDLRISNNVGAASEGGTVRLCHLYVNNPDNLFERALKAEAEKVASERSRAGFPISVVARHAMGVEAEQLKQIEADRSAAHTPDLFVIIPVDQDAVYRIVSEILSTSARVTCVLLHQPLSPILQTERKSKESRLFGVAADQVEIGRIQARQLAALLPRGGSVLYVQGEEHSYATRHRTKGLMEEFPKHQGLKLNGYRVFGDWSGSSVGPALENWSRLGGRLEWVDAAAAQNDDMAIALAELAKPHGLPVLGVDGMETGKRAVDDGLLAATVVQPLGVGHALRTYESLCGGQTASQLVPADGNILLAPESYPPLEKLQPRTR
jgi:ribose transport system substrate-binding protein